MFTPLSLFIGLRYTAAKRRNQLVSFISAISMAGLVLGVALLITVLSVMSGFDREMRDKILGLMPQGAIYHQTGIDNWTALSEELLAHPNVTAVSPFIRLQALATYRQQVTTLALFGIDPEREQRVSIIGDHLQPQSLATLAQGGNRVILAAGVADTLQRGIGDTVRLVVPSASGGAARIAELTIVDVFRTGTEVDNSLALVNLVTAAELKSGDVSTSTLLSASSSESLRVDGIKLKMDELLVAPKVVRELVYQLPYGYFGSDWTRTHGNLFQAIQMSKQMVGLLLFLIIAIAAFNVVSTLVMVVIDKQADIAILRTQGMSSTAIVMAFMTQGTLIGVVGVGIGTALGVGLSLVVTDVVAWFERFSGVQFLKSDVYPISYLPSDLRWEDVLMVATVGLLMSCLATLYPAWRAAKVKPADALRHE